ncbi:hypothetical protein [Clostridium thermarum]|uniref:hypothetical protein n=1 Tax=Clostridium thermarum TaxID=1716543 RepID=UPI0013D1AC78|nr:hypothetical protein [Clostridium thermarum]
MKNHKYREFYFWQNLIHKNENLTEGYFRGIPLCRESVFVNTVIVNCNTSVLYDWWICFPDVFSALGFIQNIFLTSVFNSYLNPDEDYVAIINGTGEELLEAAEDGTNCTRKYLIPDMRRFLEDIDTIWEEDQDKIFTRLKEYSLKFNSRWGDISEIFAYFNIFRSPQEVGEYVVEGYKAENMLSQFAEETGFTIEQWEDVYLNLYENEFMKKKFVDILNNKICNLL